MTLNEKVITDILDSFFLWSRVVGRNSKVWYLSLMGCISVVFLMKRKLFTSNCFLRFCWRKLTEVVAWQTSDLSAASCEWSLQQNRPWQQSVSLVLCFPSTVKIPLPLFIVWQPFTCIKLSCCHHISVQELLSSCIMLINFQAELVDFWENKEKVTYC